MCHVQQIGKEQLFHFARLTKHESVAISDSTNTCKPPCLKKKKKKSIQIQPSLSIVCPLSLGACAWGDDGDYPNKQMFLNTQHRFMKRIYSPCFMEMRMLPNTFLRALGSSKARAITCSGWLIDYFVCSWWWVCGGGVVRTFLPWLIASEPARS